MQRIVDTMQWFTEDGRVGPLTCLFFFASGLFVGFFCTMMVNYSLYARLFQHLRDVTRRKNRGLREMRERAERAEAEAEKLRKSEGSK